MREPSVGEVNWQNCRGPVSTSQLDGGPLVPKIGMRSITVPLLCTQYAAAAPLVSGSAALMFPAADNSAAAVAIKNECFKTSPPLGFDQFIKWYRWAARRPAARRFQPDTPMSRRPAESRFGGARLRRAIPDRPPPSPRGTLWRARRILPYSPATRCAGGTLPRA